MYYPVKLIQPEWMCGETKKSTTSTLLTFTGWTYLLLACRWDGKQLMSKENKALLNTSISHRIQ